jgi:hypothetical protein
MVNKSPLPNPTKADAEYISCIPPCNKIFQKFYNSLAACRQSLNGRSNDFSFNPMHTNGEVIRKAIIAHPMDHSHLAAEQRAAVAHGVSHGFGQAHISKAPDWAAENRFVRVQCFFIPPSGLFKVCSITRKIKKSRDFSIPARDSLKQFQVRAAGFLAAASMIVVSTLFGTCAKLSGSIE